MWSKLFEAIFNRENLKTNGLYIIIILLILLTGLSGYGMFKILTNDTHDRKEREEKVVGALIQQAVSNQDVASALRELKQVIKQR